MYGLRLAILSIFIFIFIESTVFSFPITLLSVLLLFVFTRSVDVFLLAFFVGIVLDILKVHPVGISSAYFILYIFLTSLYSRKYEIETLLFVFIMGLMGSFIYSFLVEHTIRLLNAFSIAVIGGILFVTFQMIRRKTASKLH